MIILFITLSVVFTVLLLIIGFENVQSTCIDLAFFFAEIDSNTTVTFLIFGVGILGVLTGMSYAGLIWSVMKSSSDEDDDWE